MQVSSSDDISLSVYIVMDTFVPPNLNSESSVVSFMKYE